MKKLQTLIAGVILGSMLIFTPTYATEVATTEAATTEYVTQPTLRTLEQKKYDIQKITIKGKSKRVLYVGKKIELKVKVNPKEVVNVSKKIKWVSSNKKIATVNAKGKVVTKKPGTVYIYAKSKKNEKIKDKVKITVKQKYSEKDLRLLSAIIFCEAGNQCYAGKKAVGIVVMNRVKSDKFPNTVEDVLYQSGQFTPAHTGFLSSSLSKYDRGKLPSKCIKAAKEVLEGSRSVELNDKTVDMSSYLFFSRYVRGCRLEIQDHQFK